MSIPTTASELESFIRKHQAEWPDDLRRKAHRALLTLKSMPAAMKSPAVAAASRDDLQAFAEAYSKWRGE